DVYRTPAGVAPCRVVVRGAACNRIRMSRFAIACVIVSLAGCGQAASSRAPGGARVLQFSVVTVGRPSGDAEVRFEPDGKRLGHFTFNDRGRGPDLRTEIELDDKGWPR